MKQFDANSNNSWSKLKNNLSAEEAKNLSFLGQDIDIITRGTETEGLLLDNRGFVQELLSDFHQITGKELLKSTLLILLFISVSILGVFNGYWDTGTYDTVGLRSVYEIQDEALSSTETDHINTGNTASIIEKPGVVPLERPITGHRTTSTRAEIATPVLTLPFNPVISTLPTTRIFSLDFNSSEIINSNLISNNSTNIHAFTLNKIKGNWIPLIGTELPINNYQQQPDDTNAKSSNIHAYSWPLRFELYKEKQEKHTEIIKIPYFKGKEITLLTACISGYQKTDMKVKKDMILFISSHGTLSVPDCGISSAPEGIRPAQDQLIHCEPFIKKFDTGALLYRFGNDDTWKEYSTTQGIIVAEKDGLLEFFINVNLPNKEKIRGHYAVAVSTSQLNLSK